MTNNYAIIRSQLDHRNRSSDRAFVRRERREGRLYLRLRQHEPRDTQARNRLAIPRRRRARPTIRRGRRGGGKGGRRSRDTELWAVGCVLRQCRHHRAHGGIHERQQGGLYESAGYQYRQVRCINQLPVATLTPSDMPASVFLAAKYAAPAMTKTSAEKKSASGSIM